jgi:hypothetical protein
MVSEPIAVTMLVIDELEALNVPYLIGGSLASAVYGVARTTNDADLVAELELEHVDSLVHALGNSFYVNADSIRDAIRRKSSFNLIHLKTMFKVDVFIHRQSPYDREQFKRRILQVVSTPSKSANREQFERQAYFARAEDTILSKLVWYRMGGEISDRQWQDVLGVLQVQGDRLDLEYLRHWADLLEIAGLLEKALVQIGGG